MTKEYEIYTLNKWFSVLVWKTTFYRFLFWAHPVHSFKCGSAPPCIPWCFFQKLSKKSSKSSCWSRNRSLLIRSAEKNPASGRPAQLTSRGKFFRSRGITLLIRQRITFFEPLVQPFEHFKLRSPRGIISHSRKKNSLLNLRSPAQLGVYPALMFRRLSI